MAELLNSANGGRLWLDEFAEEAIGGGELEAGRWGEEQIPVGVGCNSKHT